MGHRGLVEHPQVLECIYGAQGLSFLLMPPGVTPLCLSCPAVPHSSLMSPRVPLHPTCPHSCSGSVTLATTLWLSSSRMRIHHSSLT